MREFTDGELKMAIAKVFNAAEDDCDITPKMVRREVIYSPNDVQVTTVFLKVERQLDLPQGCLDAEKVRVCFQHCMAF